VLRYTSTPPIRLHGVVLSWSTGQLYLLPYLGDRPTAKPLTTQGSTTQKNTDIHPCVEWDLNPQSHCSSGARYTRPLGPKLEWHI